MVFFARVLYGSCRCALYDWKRCYNAQMIGCQMMGRPAWALSRESGDGWAGDDVPREPASMHARVRTASPSAMVSPR